MTFMGSNSLYAVSCAFKVLTVIVIIPSQAMDFQSNSLHRMHLIKDGTLEHNVTIACITGMNSNKGTNVAGSVVCT